MKKRRVLFVSKPIVAPFRDGTKCLVRDVAANLQEVTPLVMAPSKRVELSGRQIEALPVYRDSGRYAPGLNENVRAAVWLMLARRHDLWHFVFAPNPRTSRIARWLKRARGARVVQTVASAPRQFSAPEQLLFGDRVVVQSRWAEKQFRQAAKGTDRLPPLEVIVPPVGPLAPRSPERHLAIRQHLAIEPECPLYVYPGDLEVSSGAQDSARLVRHLAELQHTFVLVFAYRAKTSEAHQVARGLRRKLPASRVRFTYELDDVLSLISGAQAVVFPVDDLWGKVDHPIVLLESMLLGVPVVSYSWGPLAELEGSRQVAPGDVPGLARQLLWLQRDKEHRRATILNARSYVQRVHGASRVSRAYERIYLKFFAGQPT